MLLPAFTSSYCLLKSCCLGKRFASSLSKAEPKQGEVWGPGNSYTFQTAVLGVQEISDLD